MNLLGIYLGQLAFIFIAGFCLPVSADFDGMNEAICRDQKHFVDCFGWSLSDCHEQANKALKICFDYMPERPVGGPTLEEELKNPMGATVWGQNFGWCGEIVLFQKNQSRLKSECRNYFLEREKEAKNTTYAPSLYRLFNKEKSNGWNTLLQMFLILIPSLLFPFSIAIWRWKKQRPQKFPLGLAQILIFASILGIICGMFLVSFSGAFAEGVRLRGDNPEAIGGSILGIVILIPSYWLGLHLIFKKFKSTPG